MFIKHLLEVYCSNSGFGHLVDELGSYFIYNTGQE